LSEATNVDLDGQVPTLTLDGKDLEIRTVTEDPEDPEKGDHLVCYVEAASGHLEEKLLD
jgi:hypothetical protein